MAHLLLDENVAVPCVAEGIVRVVVDRRGTLRIDVIDGSGSVRPDRGGIAIEGVEVAVAGAGDAFRRGACALVGVGERTAARQQLSFVAVLIGKKHRTLFTSRADQETSLSGLLPIHKARLGVEQDAVEYFAGNE